MDPIFPQPPAAPRPTGARGRRVARGVMRASRARLEERDAVFRAHGYDPARAAAFILDQALPLPGRLLEIGTGQGRFLAALLARVPRVTTVDIDPDEQHRARLNVAAAHPPGRARYVIADAARLPWPDRSFHGVISVNALHHFGEISRVVDEILRVVKKDGKIVLADLNARGLSILAAIHAGEGRVHAQVPVRFEDIAARLAAAGWRTTLRPGDCVDMLMAVPAAVPGTAPSAAPKAAPAAAPARTERKPAPAEPPPP